MISRAALAQNMKPGMLCMSPSSASLTHAPARHPCRDNFTPISDRCVTVCLTSQPKFILDFIDKQAETDADIVSGTRYAAGGGVFGWDFRRKLISCGANILALTMLQPKARLRKGDSVTTI